jgi:hypothetical protein
VQTSKLNVVFIYPLPPPSPPVQLTTTTQSTLTTAATLATESLSQEMYDRAKSIHNFIQRGQPVAQPVVVSSVTQHVTLSSDIVEFRLKLSSKDNEKVIVALSMFVLKVFYVI